MLLRTTLTAGVVVVVVGGGVRVGTGRSTLQKRVMALLRRIEHPTLGNIEVSFSLSDVVHRF